ncbi:MAG: bifunctional hydroxymethylpyrimidine kinase/phosphomethylpyrimidine kinase [Thermoplasmata archaeon]
MGRTKKVVLTIGGSDSSGGAGIQADVKALSAIGVHACTVVTCITAQNTKQISEIYPLPLNVIDEQLKCIIKDIRPKIFKTGMLYRKEIIGCVAKNIVKKNNSIVVDPVMSATVGKSLISEDYLESLKSNLIPFAKIVTPNIFEASVIANMKIKDISDVKNACKKIHKLGCEYVLIKGGHLNGNAVDVLFDGRTYKMFSMPRVAGKMHGTGCTFASFIAGFLAKGMTVEYAVKNAKDAITKAIESKYSIGAGVDVIRPTIVLERNAQKFEVLDSLKNAVMSLEKILPLSFIPRVGINFAYALPNAITLNDVCGIRGRIMRIGNRAVRTGGVEFGASKHVATIALTAMAFDENIRSALNIAYSENRIEQLKNTKFIIRSFDRKNEPAPKGKKISTMEWGTQYVIKKMGRVPDIVYDKGSKYKEAMIRILGKDPNDVLEKLKMIITPSPLV